MPLMEVDPTGQKTHDVPLTLVVPVAQTVQEVEPVVLLYVPAGHATQILLAE